ncbi:hypothetical protein JG688_00008984 [Phytophthora aleatoria]|uniref:Mediator complex subunit 15 KIX domain-containing protein n=1 Tax=Phytophthora aleatoria TaxID=2496075 RepID=A0A8J5J791_9STRA|nr:hypothetical protein JG688_00008984 [Phytophthora aleatoria]
MDSFGFDFAGGDLLDLGSLGSWTNSTPMSNSPNGGSGGALPFSVGTPTGVQSLGDDPFATMPGGGDNDFSFGDSPKPSPHTQSQKPGDNAVPTSAAVSAPTSSAPPTSSAGEMAANYFGSELEASSAPSSATTGTTSSAVTTDASSSADDKAKMNAKNETDSQTKKEAPTSTSQSASASNATSSTTTSAATSSAPHKSESSSQPGQVYRPPTSSYEEEFARVKAMMMQHPDLIPPPMEVLRISMSQSAANQQNMTMGANAYAQRGNPAMNRGGAPGNAAYAQYGNPNMMMGNPQQNAQQAGMMNAARLRAAQMAQQQAQQRAAAGRTPSGSNDTQTAWQSENDLPLRRKMIGKIVSLLQQRKPDAPAEWIRRLPDMARRLEDSLYRTAKNRDDLGESSDFLNLDLSSSLLGSDDLQGDGSSNLSGGDAMKNGSSDSAHLTGQKRTLSQSQQQMAAAANAAAFKRTKVGGAAGQAGSQSGAAPNQQHPGAATSGPQASQPSQKPVTSSSGSSKTPPMSTVNAK